MNIEKSEINLVAYTTDAAIEKYSHYYLYENEKYLFNKYFGRGQSILDLACGAGRTTVLLHEMGFLVKGIDLSEPLIKIASKRFPYIEFEIGSYTDIKADDSSYDNVLISHNGLDYAYPESQREKAIQETFRVLKVGGHFIFSTHNIQSLYGSPYYLRDRVLWLMKNMRHAFKQKAYLKDLNMYTFYTSTEYCINQVSKFGFTLVDMVGFKRSHSLFFNKYISPYVHFVFRKS